jgi:heptosyltransferase II
MPVTSCRYFNGYKPCGRHSICDQFCPSMSVPSTRILVISLEAMGAVLRSTVILPAIKAKFPNSHITWITKKPMQQILRGNPYIDRVLAVCEEDLLVLSALEFDIAYVIDKSLVAAGVLSKTTVDLIYGFVADPNSGSILPATSAAKELWEIGLNDEKKFFLNQKPETQLLLEALELSNYQPKGYSSPLTEADLREVDRRLKTWRRSEKPLIGVNTGCSGVIPYKKLTVEFQRKLITEIKKQKLGDVVLLGGPEDTVRNQQIAYGLDVIETPTLSGVKDGYLSAAACDVIVTGDSLGMHMGIALEKWVVAWFGPTCAQEIDLFGRGRKVLSQVSCGPCWKRLCQNQPMCYDLVPLNEILKGIVEGIEWLTSATLSSKLPSLET